MNVDEKKRGALFIIAPLVIALIAVWVIYDPFHMISSDPKGGEGGFTHTPVWLWVIGVAILGSVIAYGISQTRRRSRGEAHITQETTAGLYRREEADRKRQGLP
jgi:hypothetical protein